MRSLTRESVDKRIAYALLLLYESLGNVLNVRHEEIAEMAGTARETTVRALADFRRKKFVSSQRKKITVLNPRALWTITEEPGHLNL